MSQTRTPGASQQVLSEGKRRFFESFGYVVLRGWLADDIGWISDEFDALFQRSGVDLAPERRRTMIMPFIDHSPRLAALLEHPAIDTALSGLLGADWQYLPGEGNVFFAGTGWHIDGPPTSLPFIKIAMYLEPVGSGTGTLRFIPASHQRWIGMPDDPSKVLEAFDVTDDDVPAPVIESSPGDLLVFLHHTYHASSGSQPGRRMFTINACRPVVGAAAEADFAKYLDRHVKYAMNRSRKLFPDYVLEGLYGRTLMETASERMRPHLALAERYDPVVADLVQQYLRSPLEGWHF